MTAKPAPDTSPAPVAVADKGRYAARLGVTYVMRLLGLIAQTQGGDWMKTIILLRLAAANTTHLDAGGEPSPYTANADSPPDEVRRLISVLRLANSLGIPFETTRRYVNMLIAEGVCRRVKGGVIIAGKALEGAALDEVRNLNIASLRRLTHDLGKAGLAD